MNHSMLYTPLAPYQYAVSLSWAGGGNRRAGETEQLTSFRLRAVEVSQLPVPPALLPWHPRGEVQHLKPPSPEDRQQRRLG